jgi:hypothetical protein
MKDPMERLAPNGNTVVLPDVGDVSPGTPCQPMWDRLDKIYGADKSVEVALTLLKRNETIRRISLVGADS